MATSTQTQRRTTKQLVDDGFAALVEKLGVADALRYLQVYELGEGDYTRERHKWLDTLSHEEFVSLMSKTPPPHSMRPHEHRQAE